MDDECYIESGYPPLEVMIHSIQHKFFWNTWREKSIEDNDPLTFAMDLSINIGTNTGGLSINLWYSEVNDRNEQMERVRSKAISNSTQSITCKGINHTLTVHTMINTHLLDEKHHMPFTQLRTGGHWTIF